MFMFIGIDANVNQLCSKWPLYEVLLVVPVSFNEAEDLFRPRELV
jgi:hypothetical protein